ncbi:hypothetical protein FQZ97_1134940 [compost metagenome]
MRHNACDFFRCQAVEEASRGCDGCVFRIAARGKGIGLVFVNDVNLRHRQTCIGSETTDHPIIIGAGTLIHFLRIIHAQHHLVRIPVAKQVHGNRDHKRDHHATTAAQQIADAHEHDCHESNQHGSFRHIHAYRSPVQRELISNRVLLAHQV